MVLVEGEVMTVGDQIAKRADNLQLRAAAFYLLAQVALNLLGLAPVIIGWLAGFVVRLTLLGVAAVLHGYYDGLGKEEE